MQAEQEHDDADLFVDAEGDCIEPLSSGEIDDWVVDSDAPPAGDDATMKKVDSNLGVVSAPSSGNSNGGVESCDSPQHPGSEAPTTEFDRSEFEAAAESTRRAEEDGEKQDAAASPLLQQLRPCNTHASVVAAAASGGGSSRSQVSFSGVETFNESSSPKAVYNARATGLPSLVSRHKSLQSPAAAGGGEEGGAFASAASLPLTQGLSATAAGALQSPPSAQEEDSVPVSERPAATTTASGWGSWGLGAIGKLKEVAAGKRRRGDGLMARGQRARCLCPLLSTQAPSKSLRRASASCIR